MATPLTHTTRLVPSCNFVSVVNCARVLYRAGALEILKAASVFDAREYSVWTCRLYKVIHYTAGDVSIWLLVTFTFDRFIAVCFPLRYLRLVHL